jgi:hypothetical protein
VIQPPRLTKRGRQVEVHGHRNSLDPRCHEGSWQITRIVQVEDLGVAAQEANRRTEDSKDAPERSRSVQIRGPDGPGTRGQLAPLRPQIPLTDVQQLDSPSPRREAFDHPQLGDLGPTDRTEVMGDGEKSCADQRPAPFSRDAGMVPDGTWRSRVPSCRWGQPTRQSVLD